MYGKLTEFLKGLPAEQKQIALEFDELGDILGQPLPSSASDNRPWWGNQAKPGRTQSSAWLAAGWLVEKVYLPARVVVFRRCGEDLVRAIPAYVQALLGGSRRVVPLDAHRLARWLRFCRQVGWYFQGTVLYEKSGVDIDLLSEVEQSEVEEDYVVCKRELLRYRK